jgi:hypothetical protein
MVNTNMTAGAIDDYGRILNTVGNTLADVSTAFKQATTAAQPVWQGAAAAQAHGFFNAVSDHAAETSTAAQLSSNHYSQQAAAASYAQTNMPPPSGFNQKAEMDKAAKQIASGDLAGGVVAMNAIPAKQQQADADHAQAVQVMNGLDGTYNATASTQPTYTPPPTLNSDQTVASSASSSFSTPGGGGANSFAPGGGGGVPAGGGGPVPGGGQGPVGGFAPGNVVGAGNGPTNFGGGPGGGLTGTAGAMRPPLGPDGMPMIGGGSAGGGGGDITRSGNRIGGSFAGSRVSGSQGKAGFAAEEELGQGKGSGTGGGKAGVAGERLAPGAETANAKAGANGAPGAGGKKDKEEDEEHKNKTPTTEDPDEIFAAFPDRGPDGQVVAPPVIGA